MVLEAGVAQVDIEPDFTGFGRKFKSSLTPHLRVVGSDLNNQLTQDFTKAGNNASAALGHTLQRSTGRLTSIMAAAGKAMAVGFTVALGGAAAAIVKIGSTYEQSLNVFQSVSQASAATMDEVRAKAKALGADLSLPATSAADAAAAMTELVKAGLSVNDTMAASKGVLQLAAAAQVDEARAAQITANALNAFHLSGDQAVRVADLLAAAANSSSGEITDMADALQMSAAVFSAAHIPIEDLTAAIAEMANQGIIGSDAGTSLKQMLLALQTPSKKAQTAMSELGISLYDANGAMVPFRDLIGQFSGALATMTQEQREAALGTIFGSDAIRSSNIVLAGGVEAFDKMTAAVTRQGAAAEVAAAKTKGLAGAWEGLKSQLETGAIDAFERLSPALEAGLRTLSGQVPALMASFAPAIDQISGALLPALGPVLTVLGSLLSALGPVIAVIVRMAAAVTQALLPVIESLTPVVAELSAVFGEVFLSALQVLAPVLREVGAVFAVAMLDVLRELRPYLPDLSKAFAEWATASAELMIAIAPLMPVLAHILIQLAPLLAFIIRLQAGFSRLASGALAVVVRGITEFGRGMIALVGAFRDGGNDITSSGFAGALEQVGVFLRDVYDSITRFVVPAAQTLASVAVTAWGALSTAAGVAWSILKPILMGIGAVVYGVVLALEGMWKSAQMVWSGITAVVSTAWSILQPIFGFIVSLGFAIVMDAASALWHYWQMVWNGITTATNAAWLVIQGIWNVLVSFVRTVLAPVFTFLWQNVVVPVWEGIKAAISTAWDFIRPIWDAIKTFINNVLVPAFRFLGTVWGEVWGGIRDVARSIWGEIKQIVGDAVNGIKGIVAGFLDIVAGIADVIPGADRVAGVLHGAADNLRGKASGGVLGSALEEQRRIGGLATGGALGFASVGPGFVTNGPKAIVGEGRPQHPEYVVPTDPQYRSRALRLYQGLGADLGIPGMADGGIIDRAKDFGGDLIDKVMDAGGWLAKMAGKGAAAVLDTTWPVLPVGGDVVGLLPAGVNSVRSSVIDFLRGSYDAAFPAGGAGAGGFGWQAIVSFLTAKGIPHTVTSTTGGQHVAGSRHYRGLAADLVSGNMRQIFDSLLGVGASLAELFYDPAGFSIKNGARANFTVGGHSDHVHAATFAPGEGPPIPGGGGGGAGGALDDWIREAIRVTGVPADWFGGLRARAMQESSGNPRAQNNWDSNARAGTPSMGLMQTIRPTFDSYKLPGHDDIWNPVDNMIAAIRYIQRRYGSPYNLPRGGYKAGGVLPFAVADQGANLRPGLNLLDNRTGELERLRPVGGDGASAPATADEIARAVASALDGVQVVVGNRQLGVLTIKAQHEARRAYR